jgi:HD-GYP domain-containing protein (c-di-GMP phosphodiesterase class II)
MLMHNLPTAASQLDAMLQAFPDVLFTLDEDGTILDYKGGRALSTLFAAPEAFIGRVAGDVLPAGFTDSLQASLRQLKAADGPVSFEYVSQQAGVKRWFEARLVRSSDGQVVMVVRDATRHRVAEEKVKSQLSRMASLRAIDQTIASSRDLRLALSVVLSQVTAELKADAADILLLNSENKLEFATGIGFRTETAQKRLLAPGQSLAGLVAEKREIVRVAELQQATSGPGGSPEFQGEDFRSYYGVPLLAKGRACGVMEILHRHPLEPDAEWLGFMEALAGQAALAIENASLLKELQHTHFELTLAYDTTIEGWARALDLRDRATEDHTQRVAAAAVKLARRLGLGNAGLVQVRRGAMLHDIGKMAIPDSILLKNGPLTADEWQEVRRHPQYAYELLSPIPYLADCLDIPRYHHERWDGTGYPYGMKGKEIPLAARLFAVIDVYDALTAARPYRPGWDPKLARDYMQQEGGKQFDPEISAEFLRMLDGGEMSNSAPA